MTFYGLNVWLLTVFYSPWASSKQIRARCNCQLVQFRLVTNTMIMLLKSVGTLSILHWSDTGVLMLTWIMYVVLTAILQVGFYCNVNFEEIHSLQICLAFGNWSWWKINQNVGHSVLLLNQYWFWQWNCWKSRQVQCCPLLCIVYHNTCFCSVFTNCKSFSNRVNLN